MRKKSHISLARYMVENLNDDDLKKHRLSFYLGSILPDIKPSFLYKKHEITGTFPNLSRHIKRLSEGEKLVEKKKKGTKYYMDLGQVSHYLADYFTFPHDRSYSGSLKEHCSYEEKLKKDLRSYIKSDEAVQNMRETVAEKKRESFYNAEALCRFIQKTHDEYIGRKHTLSNDVHYADDIRHIVSVNYCALKGMTELLAQRRANRKIGGVYE